MDGSRSIDSVMAWGDITFRQGVLLLWCSKVSLVSIFSKQSTQPVPDDFTSLRGTNTKRTGVNGLRILFECMTMMFFYERLIGRNLYLSLHRYHSLSTLDIDTSELNSHNHYNEL